MDFERLTTPSWPTPSIVRRWWLDEALDKAGKEVCTFAYFGPTDLRYVMFVLAGMKTGRKVSDTIACLNVKALKWCR